MVIVFNEHIAEFGNCGCNNPARNPSSFVVSPIISPGLLRYLLGGGTIPNICEADPPVRLGVTISGDIADDS